MDKLSELALNVGPRGVEIIVAGKGLPDYFPGYEKHVPPIGISNDPKIEEYHIRLFTDAGQIDYELSAHGRAKNAYAQNARRFLVCCECHDWGCGGVSGEIHFSGDRVEWRNFEAPVFDEAAGMQTIPDKFVFDRTQYLHAFARLQESLLKELSRRR